VKGIDTNVLVRYLVQDEPRQSKKATTFIEKYCSIDAPCFISHIVLCELTWVLESNYGQNRVAIASIIEQLLLTAQLELMESEVVWKALRDYINSNADFSDHLIARVNESKGCDETMTLDKKAGNQPLFSLL